MTRTYDGWRLRRYWRSVKSTRTMGGLWLVWLAICDERDAQGRYQ